MVKRVMQETKHKQSMLKLCICLMLVEINYP